MNTKQSEIDAAIARVEESARKELLSVFNGETSPRDDFEKHLVEATKIRNKVVMHECENPSSALKEAQRHLEEAKNICQIRTKETL